ncbi:MAG: hypothetical protein GY847_29795 [Proteobacteria bacterium]|nr:hypothetical protein [Pseudomonadota bacterium]
MFGQNVISQDIDDDGEPSTEVSEGEFELNFSTVIMYATIVNLSTDQAWLKGIGVDGSLTLNALGEVCGARACPKAEYAIDVDLVALTSEVDPSALE